MHFCIQNLKTPDMPAVPAILGAIRKTACYIQKYIQKPGLFGLILQVIQFVIQ